MSARRMSALLEKDFKEAIRNPSIILMPIVIIGLSYMWRVAFGKDIPENIVQMFQLMLINLTLVMISLSTLMNLFAEENDKGTLKGLIKTPASLIEIIISKIFIILIITLLSTIISLFIFNHPLYLRWSTYIGIILIYFIYSCIGVGFGFLAQTIGKTTFFNLISLFLFGMMSLFTAMPEMKSLSSLKQFSKYLPGNLTLEIELQHYFNFIYLIIWLLVSLIFMLGCYRYRFRKN